MREDQLDESFEDKMARVLILSTQFSQLKHLLNTTAHSTMMSKIFVSFSVMHPFKVRHAIAHTVLLSPLIQIVTSKTEEREISRQTDPHKEAAIAQVRMANIISHAGEAVVEK